ncbi:uncharacterized protein LOC122281342 [Carya illinoinensis]|uniref:uncharacterized protein LOC122281342 n=1 Tax=Carya illinoinensis TaxID=32201 RepID=UPI001C719D74|nr:uncharacterized protein LOC122281342 [Carya illinoinensis]
MADDDLTKQWENLHLSREETTVVHFKTEVGNTNSSIRGKLGIIGRILSERGVNNEVFRSTMSQIWRLEGWVHFKDMNEQCFLIEFQSKKDKDKILSGRPWCFDRNLLTIQEVDESLSINVVNIQYEPFWVQCYNVPLAAMNEEIGIQIGENIGRVIRVDADSDGFAWGRCLRVRVHKPLLRGICMTREHNVHGSKEGYNQDINTHAQVKASPDPIGHRCMMDLDQDTDMSNNHTFQNRELSPTTTQATSQREKGPHLEVKPNISAVQVPTLP